MTNLYLVWCEMAFLERKCKQLISVPEEIKDYLRSNKRYIDDIIAPFKSSTLPEWLYFSEKHDGIYPSKLLGPGDVIINKPLQLSGNVGKEICYLDVCIKAGKQGKQKQTKISYVIFDKRTKMYVNNIPLSNLRNFPHIDSKLALSCKLGVISSQLFRLNRRTTNVYDFIIAASNLAVKMINHGYEYTDVMKQIESYRKWKGGSGKWQNILKWLRTKINMDLKSK